MRISKPIIFSSFFLLVACGGGGSNGISAGLGAAIGNAVGSGASPTNTQDVINSAPVANAGVAQNALTGSKVTLDGSKSTDANNETITLKWTLTKPVGSNAALSSSTDPKPTFTADITGIYVASLVANDGKVDSAAAQVTVIAAPNAAPVANAGIAQNVLTGSKVTLDGSKSTDANNETITFKWTLTKPVGSNSALSSSTDPKPTFTADVTGTYVASLVANDGKDDSAAVQVNVIAAPNAAPVANAGIAQNVLTGSKVTLDGSKSNDANNDKLTYKWVMNIKPINSTAVLSSSTDAMPTFTADLTGIYATSLIVNDGQADSLPAGVAVNSATANSAPVAIAGLAQNVLVGATVTLNGNASTDANGDFLTYKWILFAKPAGSFAVLSSDTNVMPTFAADLAGTYVASLVVSDGIDKSELVAIAVSAALGNVSPVANPGKNKTVANASLVTLDGSASSDANRDTLTYAWVLLSQPTGSAAVLSSLTAAKPTFTADVPGTYVASLIVNDGKVNSAAVSVAVTSNAAPVAILGANQIVKKAATVTLDGSNSTDANNDALTYKWVMVSKPVGSLAVLSLLAPTKPTFTADSSGDYTFTLVVNDGIEDSAIVAVKVTATGT